MFIYKTTTQFLFIHDHAVPFLNTAKVLRIQQKEDTVKIRTDCTYENILDPGYSPIEFSLSKKSYCVNDRLQTNLTKIDANTEEQ